jgi:hypothetical protein
LSEPSNILRSTKDYSGDVRAAARERFVNEKKKKKKKKRKP